MTEMRARLRLACLLPTVVRSPRAALDFCFRSGVGRPDLLQVPGAKSLEAPQR